jgi:hypothetical protein
MTIDTLLDTLDHIDACSNIEARSNLASYSHQFQQQDFRTVEDLLETAHFTPDVLSNLLDPKLPYGSALRIIRCAREEVQRVRNLYFAGDHSVIC